MVKPQTIQSRVEWHSMAQDAVAKTDDLIKHDPNWQLPKAIKQQIEVMQKCVASNRAPTEEDREDQPRSDRRAQLRGQRRGIRGLAEGAPVRIQELETAAVKRRRASAILTGVGSGAPS